MEHWWNIFKLFHQCNRVCFHKEPWQSKYFHSFVIGILGCYHWYFSLTTHLPSLRPPSRVRTPNFFNLAIPFRWFSHWYLPFPTSFPTLFRHHFRNYLCGQESSISFQVYLSVYQIVILRHLLGHLSGHLFRNLFRNCLCGYERHSYNAYGISTINHR